MQKLDESIPLLTSCFDYYLQVQIVFLWEKTISSVSPFQKKTSLIMIIDAFIQTSRDFLLFADSSNQQINQFLEISRRMWR